MVNLDSSDRCGPLQPVTPVTASSVTATPVTAAPIPASTAAPLSAMCDSQQPAPGVSSSGLVAPVSCHLYPAAVQSPSISSHCELSCKDLPVVTTLKRKHAPCVSDERSASPVRVLPSETRLNRPDEDDCFVLANCDLTNSAPIIPVKEEVQLVPVAAHSHGCHRAPESTSWHSYHVLSEPTTNTTFPSTSGNVANQSAPPTISTDFCNCGEKRSGENSEPVPKRMKTDPCIYDL